VHPQAGKTADQEKLDVLVCKDQAHNAAASAGQQTKEFLLGLTLIGTPVAFESDKAKQREVFKSCMEAKGYVVEPAPEGSPDTLRKLDTPGDAVVPPQCAGFHHHRATWRREADPKRVSKWGSRIGRLACVLALICPGIAHAGGQASRSRGAAVTVVSVCELPILCSSRVEHSACDVHLGTLGT